MYIIKGFMEAFCGRIVFGSGCEGVDQFSGRGSFADEQFSHRKTAFHASLPAKQSGRDMRIITYPAKVNDPADI